ncbi:protein N-terminal glutamine amidohydrolase-like isoform X1 [Mizuhopecten yessoensis]|uniref:Protein N-terminal glutamine amidohydrolase n=2 Tax=Mizuhopecten yessoensis TaxID=6573 RepID=A0A210PWU9_MIZYE|nr:protein N-terminal glutamine amidohydrolase-like isoform X1 [Mizuhopecten yessoensis]OWF40932.1 Protein N-terminal glutamine amidohydrolase [Mizuhopecten yessoensis]
MDQSKVVDLIPTADKCTYTSCYCEENVWKLCEHVKGNNPDRLAYCYCMFISNENKQIPLWYQKSSFAPDGVVVWDYHVIFVYNEGDVSLVYDLDTKLPFPCDFTEYAAKGIRPNKTVKKQYHRKFRVIPGLKFLSTFASDRSHMLDANKQWLSDPPLYPCIQTSDSTNNIQDYISMDPAVGVGVVLDFEGLIDKFSRKT